MHPMSKSTAFWTFASLARPFEKRAVCQSTSYFRPQQPSLPPSNAFTTSLRRSYEINPYADPPNDRPRWQAPPPQMTAPFRSKPPVEGNDYAVNEDPRKLNKAYDRLLGKDGHKLLTEEVKWLAVTHKSFDHGRRGYNDRLAFLGTHTTAITWSGSSLLTTV